MNVFAGIGRALPGDFYPDSAMHNASGHKEHTGTHTLECWLGRGKCGLMLGVLERLSTSAWSKYDYLAEESKPS